MISLQKIQWKLFFKDPSTIHPHDFFRVFNTWIPNSEEIFIDVADYSHTHDGPVTLLVGHYLDYALDNTDLQLGFLYNHKQPLDGSNREKLISTFQRFLQACQKLENDASFSQKIVFKTDEIFFQINDRALASPHVETIAAVKTELTSFFDGILGQGHYTLKTQTAPKKRLGVHIQFKNPQSVAGWLLAVAQA